MDFATTQPSVINSYEEVSGGVGGPIDIARQIIELGILAVIAGIFLWQSMKHNKQMQSIYQKIQDSRGDMLTEYQEIATESMKKCLTERSRMETSHTAEEENISSELIQQRMSIMNATQKNSKADRVAYFSYHNGGRDFIGIPYQRMSCINSVVRPGITSVQQKFLNMHRASFYSIYLGLQTQDHLEFIVADLAEKDPPLFAACQQDGMASQYIHSVKNINGVDIGFVVLVYDEAPAPEDAEKLTDTTAHRIEGVTQVAEAKRQNLLKLY